MDRWYKMKDSIAVGYGIYCPFLNIQKIKSINVNASIFTAEAMAISEALNIALENKNQCNINILTDSLSIIEALEHLQLSSKTNVLLH